MRPMMRLAWIVVTLAGCGENGAGVVPHDQTLWQTLRLRFDGPTAGVAQVRLDGATGIVTPSGPKITSVAEASAGATGDLSFTPTTLRLDLRSDGKRATLGALALPLGDLRVFAPSLPPGGLQLRELALETATTTPLEVTRASEDVLGLHATAAPLRLAWKLELADGTLYPLGPLPLAPTDLHVAVTREHDGTLSLQLLAMCADGCGGIDGLFTLSDGLVWTRSTLPR